MAYSSPLCLAALLFLSTQTEAQVLKKLKDKVNQKVEQAANSILGEEPASGTTAKSGETGTGAARNDIGKYSKYDFVPGDSILFTDDLMGEESGEIPSKWKVESGKAEAYSDDGQMVISTRGGTFLLPRMNKDPYLPKQFTIEFDIKHVNYTAGYGRSVSLYLARHEDQNGGNFKDPIHIWASGDASFGQAKGQWPYELFDEQNVSTMKGWKHVAIAVNEKGVKVYVNQFRILNAQYEFGAPTVLRFNIGNDYDAPVLIKNFRIMSGGKSPAKQVTTKAVYIARGIQFEKASPKLLPESMGEINSLVQAMKDDPSLKFEISGHTSAEAGSSAEANLELSNQRANAVKAKMVELGIAEDRLTAKGYGQTKPIGSNDTPEGRAGNRRVEFLKK